VGPRMGCAAIAAGSVSCWDWPALAATPVPGW
jgi:hypothetical protein